MEDSLLVTELIAGLPKYSTSLFTAGISRFPTTPGQHIIVLHSQYLFALDQADQLDVLQFVRHLAEEVRSVTHVKRCGLAYDGFRCLQIIPMHGLQDDWKPILAPSTDFEESYPGYLWTRNSAHLEEAKLEAIQARLTNISGWTKPDYTFHGHEADDNLFARLIRGQITQWRIWEDESYLAFLTPFANSPGYTVLIPRQHLPSDILNLHHEDFTGLMSAVSKVIHVLQAGLGVKRIGMFFEGFEIDYAHIKLVPVLGDREPEAISDEYHEVYPGYLTTRLGPEETNLSKLERYR